jgi:hypothetical protein
MFAVQRGEAAEVVYDGGDRYLTLIQGSTASLAASFRQSLPFWASATPIRLTVSGTAVDGWYLTSPPVTTTPDPATGPFIDRPGPTWLLLPDVQGTGILVRAHGYEREALLAISATLEPAN